MGGTLTARYASATLLVTSLVALLARAGESAPAAPASSSVDSLAHADTLPLAPAGGLRFPRSYPCVELGISVRNLSPDLDGLASVFGHTPSFGLSPIVGGVVEFSVVEALALQFDAGLALAGDENQAYQGLAGIVLRPRLLGSRSVRGGLGGGVAVCWMHGEEVDTAVEGGATGYYANTALEWRVDPKFSLEFYGGYCGYPRQSADWTTYAQPEPVVAHPSVDFSHVIVGVRLKALALER